MCIFSREGVSLVSASRLVRKNLMVDDGKLKELARRRRMSESAVVRELVDHALVAEEVGEIFRELQERGGIADAFGKMPAGSGAKDAAPRRVPADKS